MSTPSSREKSPLLPPASAPSGASSLPSYDTSPLRLHSSGSGRVRVGLDTAVLNAQKKWKQLAEISDENSTAKDMASEVQSEFAALRQKKRDQDLHRLDIAEDEEEEDDEDERPLQHLPLPSPPPLFTADYAAELDEKDKYLIAAAFIRDGIHGRKILYRLDRTALFLHELFHSDVYRLFYTLVVMVSCGLAFIELPGQQNEYLAVDLVCIFIFGADVYIRWFMSSAETKRKFISRQPWAVVRLILLIITLADLFTNLWLPETNPYRYSRALRPFFLITRRRNIRIIFGSCLRALREVLIVLLLMFCLIGFFGLLGYLLFSDSSNAQGAPYFASLHSSLYTMLLIHNCLPYMVKSMYPYFKMTQWSAIYFVIFVLLTNMFLAKLTIAVSYKSYKKHTEKMLFKRLQKRKAALFAAFDILATNVDLAGGLGDADAQPSRTDLLLRSKKLHGSSRFFNSSNGNLNEAKRSSYNQAMSMITPMKKNRISLETWIAVCEHLKPNWSSVESTLVFNTIDIEHVGYLDLSDFYQLCSLLSVRLERTVSSRAAAILQFFFPSVRRHTVRKWQIKMRALLTHEKIFFGKYPVVVSEMVVGCLICLSVVQAIQVNNIQLAFSVNRSWRIVGIVLLCLFTLEVQLKLFAFGRREFFSRPFCRLDLAIVLVGWSFYVITSMKDPPNVSLVFYDLSLAVRSLRFLKLLNLFPPFHEILWTMQRILPLIVQLLLVIVSFMYAFAIVAQANYGLALRNFPADKQPLSPQWYAVREEFQVDTFAETLVTLFGVANLAGWDMVMDAAHAITNSDATYFFFFSYRIAMANILLPIFVGFLVESFVSNAKSVENTIETYVEAANTQQLKIRVEQQVGDPSLSADEEQLTLLHNKEGGNMEPELSSRAPRSATSASSAQGFRMRFKRRGSLVQNEMFDAVKLSDISRLKLMLEKKDDEVAEREMEIRQLESNVLGMQTRLNQSQRVILAYESKMEELSAQLKETQLLLRQQQQQQRQQETSQSSGPLSASSENKPKKTKQRANSWRVW
ncbi:hypothetical protein Poli38472_014329 [Pythium oligandrum]|uniref:Ion transport domain-containing protein n=1 Tax=Pythium oligandrum TaxID=41045 RepID=A0A8K1C6X0_PYTOL|nr:hypothetical protein Poli38472_014329 [Pythium oligandrum]|eukprot:TMW57726.1 hypothetical protein Poli38472_014329 [Pythium oligandrum]